MALSQAQLGPSLHSYVRGGGWLALPTTEGPVALATLARLFNVPWKAADYGVGSWVVPPSNVDLLSGAFPGFAASRSVVAKVCACRSVPSGDRVLVAEPTLPTAGATTIAEQANPKDAKAAREVRDCAVAVASRAVGAGRVAYFGDVNCEPATAELVASFCRGALAAAEASLASDEALARAATLKAEGNAAFAAQM